MEGALRAAALPYCCPPAAAGTGAGVGAGVGGGLPQHPTPFLLSLGVAPQLEQLCTVAVERGT